MIWRVHIHQTVGKSGPEAQLVVDLTADAGRVTSSIPAKYNSFEEIDHEIISSAILILPLVQEADTSESMTVLEKRVNHLVKLAQEKSL